MKKYLIDSCRHFTLMQIEDFIKQIYQAEYGCGHIMDNNVESRIREECYNIGTSPCYCNNLIDTISSEFVRVNLRPYYERGYSFAVLADMMRCVNTQGSVEGMDKRIGQLYELIQDKQIDLPLYSVKKALAKYRAQGYGTCSHSNSYRLNYNPHYRVVYKKHAHMLPVICRLDHLLYHQGNIIVAIDGQCGSGKTFYSSVLSQYYNNCDVIHCDDFYLPPSMRTDERLSTPGGNIHYERLGKVLQDVVQNKATSYQCYHCQTDSYTTKSLGNSRITIVEGSYSLHPQLMSYYNVRVLLSINSSEQKYRVKQREGADSYQQYVNKWIPLENKYLQQLDRCQLVHIDTSDIHY